MKKTIYFLMICLTGILFSCTEDDLQSGIKDGETEATGREEKFFLKRDFSVSGKNAIPSGSVKDDFIEKLKTLNQKTHFVCELSDQWGYPLWQYAYEVETTSNQGKGENEGGGFLIIPMQEEGKMYLTSLLYIKYPESENPEIYTITNDELHSFVQNQTIEQYDRESVLMTFFYFDQQIFGEERTYTNIPIELFEQMPEKGGGHGHDHEGGDSYKEFTFNIKEENENRIGSSIYCIEYYHCPGFAQCIPECDGCYTYCKSVICYTFSGGSGSGNFGGGSGGGTEGGSGGGGNNNGGTPDIPWYLLNPEIDIFLYSSYIRNTFRAFGEDFGIILQKDQLDYLQSKNSSNLPRNLYNYLTGNYNQDNAEYVYDIIQFLTQNPNTIQPQNILQRIDALEQYLYDHPYAISDIPCDQIPQWQEVAQHQVPQSVKNKLQNLDDTHTSPYYGWALQNLENANGSLVNNDYFSVTFNTMPYKPVPHQNEQFTPEEFLYYVRTNLDSFVNTNYSSFAPSNQTGYNEGAIWYSNNPMEAIIHINIPSPINNQYGDDGSVITSGYQINTNGMGGFSNGHWMFTTIKTPYASLTQGLDGEHPVSGHRKFGLIKSGSSYTIYTRGVDRVTGGLGATLLGQQNMFEKADLLWQSFQQGIKSYIQNNSYGNTVTINIPAKWRPKWQEAKNVLINNLPPSTLDECN